MSGKGSLGFRDLDPLRTRTPGPAHLAARAPGRSWTPPSQSRSASFLQTPAWGAVKSEWRRESLGWFDGDGELVGAGLVLYRQLPRVKRYLAYLPEGPVIDWAADDLGAWLAPMTAHLKEQGAFGVRMGPPVVTRRWSAAQVKEGIADDGGAPPRRRAAHRARARSAPASSRSCTELGWRPQAAEGGFAAGQPQYNFQVPLVDADGAPRTEDDVLAGHEPAVAPQHQEGRQGRRRGHDQLDRDATSDLKAFHDLYVHTAERDHFTPRAAVLLPRRCSTRCGAEEPDRIRLYLARHEGDLVAATIAIRVGAHAWYSYGASSTEKRDVRGSNAVQWAMIRDALAAGADVYDLRGITDTLDADDPPRRADPVQGRHRRRGRRVRRRVGPAAEPPLYKAFDLYMSRR